MKGFKDKDKKFHPITQSKGVRKKKDKTVKSSGIKISSGIRKKRDELIFPPKRTLEENKRTLILVGNDIYNVSWHEERDIASVSVMREADQKVLFEMNDPKEIQDEIEAIGTFKFFGDTNGLLKSLLETGVIDPDRDGALIPYNILTDPDKNERGERIFVGQVFAHDEDEAEQLIEGKFEDVEIEPDRDDDGNEYNPKTNPWVSDPEK